jgi:hypothetical protein
VGRVVIDRFAVHRAEDAHLVGDLLADVRKDRADFLTRAAEAFERVLRSKTVQLGAL